MSGTSRDDCRPPQDGRRPQEPQREIAGLARRIVRDLRRLSLRLMDEGTGERVDPEEIARVVTELPIELGGPHLRRRLREREAELVARLRREIDAVARMRLAFREGSVYCYRCETSSCRHSVPTAPEEVFLEYDPTGRPRWGEFASLCLRRGVARVDDLYLPRPAVLAVVVPAEDMKERQLSAFGRSSRVYNLLGEVCAGYLTGRSPGGKTPSRVAFTVQMVECRRRRRRGPDIELNLLVGPGNGGDSPDVLGARDREILEELIRRGRERLATRVRPRFAAGRRRDRDDHVGPLLTWLARGIEHIYRQRERRTRHAQRRAEDRRRPTHKALEEASRVPPDRLLADLETGAFVVLGGRGRAHVYGIEGRHVTSLVLQPDDVRHRTAAGRWRPATLEEWEEFRRRVLPDDSAGERGGS